MEDQFADVAGDDTVPSSKSPSPFPTGAKSKLNEDRTDLSRNAREKRKLDKGDLSDDTLRDLSSEEDSSDTEEDYSEEDEREWVAQYGEPSVNDEDWEMAEKDFTKQYNRIRQHNAISQGQVSSSAAPMVLPAINRPKPQRTTKSAKESTESSERKQEVDKRLTDQLTRLSKYASRIADIDTPYSRANPADKGSEANNVEGVFQLGVSVNRKGPSASANQKDRADRATTEQVLDARTRVILFKMIGRGVVKEINGCISTGKEANVYHAVTPENAHLALKIYKTSILIFKDRDKYVTGEFRFRRGYSRHNPRKMVRLWAEKEMRNLKRLQAAGIKCPEVLEVRENVLVMGFLGDEEGWASPRLKDAQIPAEQYTPLYHSLMHTIRKIYHNCKLIHADLSEYNILYHNSELYIIDVSQSVEHDHPAALEFLRKDLKNVQGFFEQRGAKCLGLRRAYEFVTAEKLEGEEDEVLMKWIEEKTDGEEESDEVFFNKFIPRSLGEVLNPEKEIVKVGVGKDEQVAAVKSPNRVRFTGIPEGKDDTDEEDDDEEEEESDEEPKRVEDRKPRGHRHEDREAKKERKKAAKEEQREKRKTKMPKAEKKKRIKNTRG